jgi:hypothetical protein
MTVHQEPVRWVKSRRSQDEGACVELGHTGLVRDSKNPEGPALQVDLRALALFAKRR